MTDFLDPVFAGPDAVVSGAVVSGGGPAVIESRGEDARCDDAGREDPGRDGLERDLLQCATALTPDGGVARAVTALVLTRLDSAADDRRRAGQAADPPGQAGLYRMVREACHSIERTRVRRAPRPAAGGV